MKSRGVSKTLPAFYQFMSRLEEAKLVLGRYDQKIVEGQIIKERVYKLTGEGAHALRQTFSFYSTMANGSKGALAHG